MVFVDFLFALLISFALTLVFAAIFRTRGPWGSFWVYLLVIFLGTWAGGLWLRPFGPQIYGVFWVPYLLIGIIFALLLGAAAPKTPRQIRKEMPAESVKEKREVASESVVFTMFLWFLLLIFAVSIVLAYL